MFPYALVWQPVNLQQSLWDQRLVLVIAIELLQCWQQLNYVADHKPQISQSTHVDPTTDSECQNRAMKQPGKRTHLMNDVLFYITRKATCMHVCCLPREEMEAGYTMGTEPASEASKVLPWNLGPLLWSGCCFHTWDARSFTAVAFAHFQTTLEKKILSRDLKNMAKSVDFITSIWNEIKGIWRIKSQWRLDLNHLKNLLRIDWSVIPQHTSHQVSTTTTANNSGWLQHAT